MYEPYFNTLYRASFIILYYDQQMQNYLTKYHTRVGVFYFVRSCAFKTLYYPTGAQIYNS
jgi:hypothetical protein